MVVGEVQAAVVDVGSGTENGVPEDGWASAIDDQAGRLALEPWKSGSGRVYSIGRER